MTQPIYSQPMFEHSTASGGSGARLVTNDGRALPLESTQLVSEASGGLARSVLRQRFRNPESVPLEVTYLVPLPADGAVSGYSFVLAGVTTRGVVEKAELARERYEEALLEGKSAALLEEERSSIFRQSLGNIPPGQHIDILVTIDQPLSWTQGGWELRFPTVVAPRYQNASSDTSSVVPITLGPEHEGPRIEAQHLVTLAIRDSLTERPSSPSHPLTVSDAGSGSEARIENARLDRDVVIRWGVATEQPGARLETARFAADHARGTAQYGLLTLTPPQRAPEAIARDLIVLLDTSGSMAGEPLTQAVRIISSLVQSLGDRDRLELIEFGSSARRWKRDAVGASSAHKAEALAWLRGLRASGGTEMKTGIEAALASLREGALRQVVLVSDGLIGFEREILHTMLRRMPKTCRLHSVGVGHGTNRSLLQPAARAGRGVEIIVAPGEDVEPACARLLSRLALPLVVNLRVSGSALQSGPTRPLDLYAGSPALVPLALKLAGGTLQIEGETLDGKYHESVAVPAAEAASGTARVLALFARESVADLELELAAGVVTPEEADGRIEALGVDFQISTRLTSWVALSDQSSVDPGAPTRRIEQPHVLAAGVSAEGLGLRSAQFFAGAPAPRSAMRGGAMRSRMMVGAAMPPPMAAAPAAPPPPATREGGGFFSRILRGFGASESLPAAAEAPLSTQVRGTIRINNATRFAVSFSFREDFDWHLPARVTLELAGQKLELEVEQRHSTQSGSLASGQEVRLVMKLSAPLPGLPSFLHIPGSEPILVELVA